MAGISDAIRIGYMHIDTARMYENEKSVGQGVRDGGVAREELFITSKVPADNLSAPVVRTECEASLRDLGIGYLDLFLIHWPNPQFDLAETFGELGRLHDDGLIRHLGVSNFPSKLLRRACDLAPLFCNQVENHPLLGQREILAVAAERDVLVTAYSPLAHGEIFKNQTLKEIGEAHGKTPSQVALRWLVEQPQVAAIPRSTPHDHRVANFSVFDFELTQEERQRIDALPKDRRQIDPDHAPDWD